VEGNCGAFLGQPFDRAQIKRHPGVDYHKLRHSR
jgi:hypothetical protein